MLFLLQIMVPCISMAAASEEVRVSERCIDRDCFVEIRGADSACIREARAKTWGSGFEAAVAIRDCLDAATRK